MGIMCHKNHELRFYYFNYIYCYVNNNIVKGLKFKGTNVILDKLFPPIPNITELL